MPKEPDKFEHTIGEVNDLFERLIGRDDSKPFTKRLMRLPVDGTPLSERRAERLTRDSTFYHKTFLEASCVAKMLVQLDLDTTVTNIVRADKPDIHVEFSDRPPTYVEHRIVMEPGMPFDRHLEEAELALKREATTDFKLALFERDGAFMVRLTDPGIGAREKHGLLIVPEVIALTRQLTGTVALHRPKAPEFPILARYRANVFYTPGAITGLVFQSDAGAIAFEPAWLRHELRVAVDEKLGKATGYDPARTPLWLLLTINAYDLIDIFAGEIITECCAAEGIAADTIAPFQQVVFQAASAAPVVIG